ncbi:MAG: M24 family metallopeptidase [Rhizobiaceae bacterium]
MLLNKTRAEKLMSAHGLDVLVASTPENVEYLTDHHNITHRFMRNANVFALFAPASTPQASAIIPAIEVETFVSCNSWIDDVYLVGSFTRAQGDPSRMDEFGLACRDLIERARPATSAVDGLVQALSLRGLATARIGLDETGLSVTDWNRVVEALPGASIVPASSVLQTTKLVKTPEEIDRLRRASEITELAVAAAVKTLRPGMTDMDLQRRYHAALVEHDAWPSFALFASGRRTSQPQLLTAPKVIEAGDLVRWDIGCTYKSYHSDTARQVILGKPNDRQRRLWDALSTGVEAALGLIKAGARPADLFEAAINPLRELNLTNYHRFHCGHGIGIVVYDPPMVAKDDPTSSVFRVPAMEGGLEAGMVINVEVGYYVQGIEGMLCEDTVVVTDRGCERLTNASKSLDLAEYLA